LGGRLIPAALFFYLSVRPLAFGRRRAIFSIMTKEQVKAVLDRVLTWPPERQEDAVELLKAAEEQDSSDLRLSDEQLAELRHRRAANDPHRASFEEAFKRFRARIP
jgi:hypothetical protein